MKQFVLNTGPSGMARETAREKMADAKRQCGNTPGSLMLTQPDGKGDYTVQFEDDQHAAAFESILKRLRNVDYLKVKNPVRLVARKKSATEALADAIGEAARKGTGPFSRRGPLDSFFDR